MRCPYCAGETKVVDKRDGEDSTRRRRECALCAKRFTTYERPNLVLTVVKKDGRREAYSRDKLKAGILRACEKRPISIDTIDAAVDRIEKAVWDTDEVTSTEIGERVMAELRAMDKIAYIRFASVYREFDDPVAFEREARLLRSQ